MANAAASNRTNSRTKRAKRDRPAAGRSNFSHEEVGGGRVSRVRAARLGVKPAPGPAIAKPAFIPLVQARLVRELPEGPGWLYEIKWDGYRLEAVKHGDTVKLISRNAKNLTADYPIIIDAVRGTNAHTSVMDGELVALDAKGQPSFQALQHRSALASGHRLAYFAFDLLNLNGKDLRNLPLSVRKEELAKVVLGSRVQLSANLQGPLPIILDAIKSAGLEGLVAKRRDSPYEPANRSGAWLKIQFKRQQEFVIGGYSPDGTSFSSIAVGYYENGQLMFAGKVRGGFNPRLRTELLKAMKPLASLGSTPRPPRLRGKSAAACPFSNLPTTKTGHWGEGMTAEQMAEIQWLEPNLVCQVKFTEWTHDGHLRHADYLGLRNDKSATEVIREQPSQI